MKLPNKKFLIAGFVLTALAQFAIPLKMVYDSEMTSRHGTEYKFRTSPIDPSDPFRGKYITLDFADALVTIRDTNSIRHEEYYIYIKKDNEGFARVTKLSRQPLDIPNDFFKAKVSSYNGKANIKFPFDRYYMEEGKAYEAETAYRDYNREDSLKKPAYALVAIKDGNSVLKDVIIDGMPIREFVLKERETINKNN
jgi:uncharacterized membrane-anchored protein